MAPKKREERINPVVVTFKSRRGSGFVLSRQGKPIVERKQREDFKAGRKKPSKPVSGSYRIKKLSEKPGASREEEKARIKKVYAQASVQNL